MANLSMLPKRLDAALIFQVVGILTALKLLQIAYRIYLHPLRKIPGPTLAKTSELWRTSRYFAGNWHEDIRQLHRQYGGVVRIAPNEVSVADPDLPNTVYGITQGTGKTKAYNTWQAFGGYRWIIALFPNFSMFPEQDKEVHRALRARVSNIYTIQSFVTMEEKATPVYQDVLRSLDKLAQSGAEIDFAAWANLFTYDIVTCFSIGKDMGYVRAGSDYNGFIESVHLAVYYIANLTNVWGRSNWYQNPIVKYWSRWFGSGKVADATNCLAKLSVVQAIEARKQQGPNPKGKQDMLDALFEMKSITGKPVSPFEILVELGNPLIAGGDTTAVAIAAILGPLMLDRQRYQRLQAEIDSAIKVVRSERGPSELLSFDDVKGLPYLKACITEGMRMHPSITFQLPRKAPKNGIALGGHFIPGGTVISMSTAAQNRLKTIFGEDADEWRPERWLDSDIDTLKRMEKGLSTFGYGTRACLGKNLAILSIYKLISNLVARYELQLTGPRDQPWSSRAMWFTKIEGMMVKFQRRQIEKEC
ncbi:hypothetical protein NUW58_g1654 [Xylaria curta]|uniref:Uncharacterized protein n=1 Tax=Xylaria curta TaxID=42375 RepID=A0ACC1PJC1_9PEZI|nr:hypothetical protein NUW58_g1654 [Xylaria curta]